MDDYLRQHPARDLDEVLGDMISAGADDAVPNLAILDVLLAARLFWPTFSSDEGRTFINDTWERNVQRSGANVEAFRASIANNPTVDQSTIAFIPLAPLVSGDAPASALHKLAELLTGTWSEMRSGESYGGRTSIVTFDSPSDGWGIVFCVTDSLVLVYGDASEVHADLAIGFTATNVIPKGINVAAKDLLLGRMGGWAGNDAFPEEPVERAKSALFSKGDLAEFRNEIERALAAGEGLAHLTSYPAAENLSVYFPDDADAYGGGGSSSSGVVIFTNAEPSITMPSGVTLSMLLRPDGRVLWKYEWHQVASQGDWSGVTDRRAFARLVEQADAILSAHPAEGGTTASARPTLQTGSGSTGIRSAIIERRKVWPSLADDDPLFDDAHD